MEHPANARDLESVAARIDTLLQSINDRERLISSTRDQIREFQDKTEKAVETRIAGLEAKFQGSLSDQLTSTVDYTKELYTRFERMVWLGMVLLAGSAAFIGYQTFSSIPQKIEAEVSKIATDKKAQVEEIFLSTKTNLEKQLSALKQADDTLAKQLQEFQSKIDKVVADSNRSASQKVDQIATSYDTRFRDFQLETHIQRLQRQSEVPELIAQLVQAFPTIDASRQSRVVTTLADQDIPPELVAAVRSNLETWKSQNEAAEAARLSILIRHRSEAAKNEILARIRAAVSAGEDNQVLNLVTHVWKVFSGTNTPPPTIGAVLDRFFVPGLPSRRRILANAQELATDYLPVFRTALESRAADRTLAMILEVVYYSNVKNAQLDALLARAITTTTVTQSTLQTVALSVPRLGDNIDLYRAVVGLLQRNATTFPGTITAGLPSNVLDYAIRSSAAVRRDPELLRATVSLLSELPVRVIQNQFLESYLATGNIFPRGSKLALTNQDNRRTIEETQRSDVTWTPVDIEKIERKEVRVGEGPVKVLKLSVDGADPRDQNIGVEVVVDVGGQVHTLRFFGNQRFFVESLPGHVVEAGKDKIRFGIEVRSLDIALMVGPAA